ncbi:hypothetical protein FJY71_04235 [candidate division WOR-3 bacterium]|nr:hypothetical protein [candidate division WOR-3 bacterium]
MSTIPLLVAASVGRAETVDTAWVRAYDGPRERDPKWRRFDLEPEPGQKFARGRTYVARHTKPGDSIHFCFQQGNPYGCGLMIDPTSRLRARR